MGKKSTPFKIMEENNLFLKPTTRSLNLFFCLYSKHEEKFLCFYEDDLYGMTLAVLFCRHARSKL